MRKKNSKKEITARHAREDVRTGLSTDSIKRAILENLNFVQGRIPILVTFPQNSSWDHTWQMQWLTSVFMSRYEGL
ncbi:MAG: hypothetical protein H6Q53_2276 [Deltaproteobacteria bacterium]|nr:hypothetical protein [Deltaproteobacteria bacterium]